MQDGSLYMVRLALRIPRLLDFARSRGLPLQHTDEGYAVHALTRELFGDSAPKPFAVVSSSGGWLDVLGYSSADDRVLTQHADAHADPGIHSTVRWPMENAKCLPKEWAEGQHFSFRSRVCPVIRRAGTASGQRQGAEMDAFLATLPADGAAERTREEVYAEWLTRQLAGAAERPAAIPVVLRMTQFRLHKVLRRTHEPRRRATVHERPDAVFEGTIRVGDRGAFANLLRRGIGRHRAFGFGMLLVRPSRA